MSKLSSALKLTDLDDFIVPSQACIKPVESPPLSSSDVAVHIHRDEKGNYVEEEATVTKKLEKAHVKLEDCLACSGCITSAEVVLVSQQSYQEVESLLKENQKLDLSERKYVVVSVSPQCRASIATAYGLTPVSTMKRLTTYFRTLGVDLVLDTGFARDLVLLESAREFIDRYRESRIPMLTSACPGWICYAEKTHGTTVLPYVSTTKSPQQVMGSLVKSYLAERHWQTTANRIYHVTLMPCYDKKLEASRRDFYNDLYRTRDVDCVLTSSEMQQWFSEQRIDLTQIPEATSLDLWNQIYRGLDGTESLFEVEGSGAGGYLEYVFRYAAKHLWNRSVDHMDYRISTRNPDFKELVLEIDGTIVLRFAAAYGFRNIQNLLRKMRLNKCEYHFVEVMACPSACLNGGGQIRGPAQLASREYLTQVESVYRQSVYRAPDQNTQISDLYQDWLHNSPEAIQTHLHTQYHAVEKTLINPLGAKW